jgi:hypothetical protein
MKIFDEAKKDQVFQDSLHYWNSGKTQEWLDLGIDLIMGRREGYLLLRFGRQKS